MLRHRQIGSSLIEMKFEESVSKLPSFISVFRNMEGSSLSSGPSSTADPDPAAPTTTLSNSESSLLSTLMKDFVLSTSMRNSSFPDSFLSSVEFKLEDFCLPFCPARGLVRSSLFFLESTPWFLLRWSWKARLFRKFLKHFGHSYGYGPRCVPRWRLRRLEPP